MLRKTLLGSTLAILTAAAASAQTPTPQPAPAAAPIELSSVDAAQTREHLRELLQRHPSEVGTVLALSPSLLANESYMAAYPALQAFVASHPEVASNPGFFLESYELWHDRRSPAMRFWEDVLSVLAAMVAGLLGILALAWLLRTILDQRRWSHQARIQAEVHRKLLDRMASNEQLLAYLETPAGRRFLQGVPAPVESPRPISVPVSRVLWSLQLGIVLAAAGLGFMSVATQLPTEGELPMRVLGIATLSIGVGFMVSAAASFVVSRRLGLWPAPASHPAE